MINKHRRNVNRREYSEQINELTNYIMSAGAGKNVNLEDFLNGLNSLLKKYDKKYIKNSMTLYLNNEQVHLKYNYDNNNYEVI